MRRGPRSRRKRREFERRPASLWASRSATPHRSFRFSIPIDFREFTAPEFSSAKRATNRSSEIRCNPGQKQLKSGSAERLGPHAPRRLSDSPSDRLWLRNHATHWPRQALLNPSHEARSTPVPTRRKSESAERLRPQVANSLGWPKRIASIQGVSDYPAFGRTRLQRSDSARGGENESTRDIFGRGERHGQETGHNKSWRSRLQPDVPVLIRRFILHPSAFILTIAAWASSAAGARSRKFPRH